MKPLRTLLLVAALAAAAAAGWWSRGHAPSHAGAAAAGTRRIRFYQSPMHPWIKSDQPGLCTICGMKLVPVYEGDEEFHAAGVVALGSNTPSVAGIATTAAARRPLSRTLRVAGTIDDDDSRHRVLPSAVEGRIEAMHVHHVGAEVRAGEPLATMYSPALLASVREYLALRGTPEAGSALGAAAALRLRQMGLGEAQVAALPDTFRPGTLALPLLSPVSGTVVKRSAYAGQWVKEGDALFEIADFSVMWFQFDAYERDLPWLSPGLPVVVTTPSVPGVAFTNAIAFVDPNLGEMSRVARVRVELANPLVGEGADRHRLLRHRLYAEGRIAVASPPVLAVPRSAVLNPDGRPFVWRAVGPSAYERRDVALGRRGDDDWEVTSGLDEGDRVVSAGGFLVDAQAQLFGIGAGDPSHDHGPAATNHAAATPTPPAADAVPWDALEAVLRATLDSSAALASDDLAGFHKAWPAQAAALKALASAAGPGGAGRFAGLSAPAAAPATIEAARATMHGIVDGLLPWAARLKERPGFGGLRAFKCPMTGKAFPGAPREARWLQLDAAKRNPWLGSDMPDCGTEVSL